MNLHDEGVIFDANRNALSLDTPNPVPPSGTRRTSVIQRSTFVFLSILIYRTMYPFAIIVLMRPLAAIRNLIPRVRVMTQEIRVKIEEVMCLCLLRRRSLSSYLWNTIILLRITLTPAG